MTHDAIEQDATDTLAAVARLLRHAVVPAWAQANAEGPRSTLHLLGLGIYNASCEAVAMLPADADLQGDPPDRDDVAELLLSAEELTRNIPVLDQTADISSLVLAICDLVREATS